MVQRIAVWLPNWIGDVVLSLPALGALRQLYPRARLIGVVRREICGIVKNSPDLDAVLPWDRGDRRGTLSLLRSLRRCRLDLVLVLPNSWKSAFLSRLSGARRRVGYERERRGFLLSDPVPCPADTRCLHHVDYFLRLVRALGWEGERPPLVLPVEEADRARLRRYLLGRGVERGEKLVAVHPGASKSPRGWAVERFAGACRELRTRSKARCLILGTEKEGRRWAPAFRGAGMLMVTGEIALQDVPALLSQCDLFLGNDSGLMHVAAAVGTPVVGIFGPGAVERTGPVAVAERLRAVSRSFPCSPCRQRFFRECRPAPSGKPYCLEEIGIEEVVAAGEELLGAAAGSRCAGDARRGAE